MDIKYIMLIIYSWDVDYVCILCQTEKEAIKWMNDLLLEEIETVQEEQEYKPSLVEMCETEKVLVYYDYDDDRDHCDDFFEHDYAMYKIIDINHNPIFKKKSVIRGR